MSVIEYAELTSPEASNLGDRGHTIGLLVLGAIEQHGPHLPLATDFVIAEYLGPAIGARIVEPVVVAPVLAGGCSAHHLAFPGTVHLPEDVVRGFVVAYIEAFSRVGIREIALLSTHGGNFALIGEIATAVGSRGDAHVIAYDDLPKYAEIMARAAASVGLVVPGTDIHAGGLETSQMLYLRGEENITVPPGLEGYVDGEEGWLVRLLSEGIDGLSPIGVLGRPDGASATAGEAICCGLADELADWIADEFGLATVKESTVGSTGER